MWGVEFLPGTKNSLICGTAVFEVRLNPLVPSASQPKRFNLTFGPNGMYLKSDEEIRLVSTEDIEALLPNRGDYGHDWTWENFLLAMTFWSEGNQRKG